MVHVYWLQDVYGGVPRGVACLAKGCYHVQFAVGT